jgi:hypothetical protein
MKMTTTRWTNDIDALFSLPLENFTATRNALAARMKREGHADQAAEVKAIGKPSVSAWAVNQLYWKHRKEFDRLMEAGHRFREAQAAQLTGKPADTRKASEARQNAISELSLLGAALLREGGHNPTPETLRRVSTTLGAISAYKSLPNTLLPGRLTEDVEAPGFDALTELFSGSIPAKKPQKSDADEEKQQPDQKAAKAALREAEQTLTKAEARARALEDALEKASAILEEADKRKREAEERFRDAKVAFEEAASNVVDAKRLVEHASRQVDG